LPQREATPPPARLQPPEGAFPSDKQEEVKLEVVGRPRSIHREATTTGQGCPLCGAGYSQMGSGTRVGLLSSQQRLLRIVQRGKVLADALAAEVDGHEAAAVNAGGVGRKERPPPEGRG